MLLGLPHAFHNVTEGVRAPGPSPETPVWLLDTPPPTPPQSILFASFPEMPITIVLAESCPVWSLANVFMAEDQPHIWRTRQMFVSIPLAPGGPLAAPSGGGSERSFPGASPPGAVDVVWLRDPVKVEDVCAPGHFTGGSLKSRRKPSFSSLDSSTRNPESDTRR